MKDLLNRLIIRYCLKVEEIAILLDLDMKHLKAVGTGTEYANTAVIQGLEYFADPYKAYKLITENEILADSVTDIATVACQSFIQRLEEYLATEERKFLQKY